MKELLIVTCICFALCLPVPAVSGEVPGPEEDSKIEDMVVTATMTEKIKKDAPGSVEVITAQEIQEMGADTVAQALEEATGLMMTTETGRMMRPQYPWDGKQAHPGIDRRTSDGIGVQRSDRT